MRPTRRPSRPSTRPPRRAHATLLAALPLTDAGGRRQQSASALLGEGHPLARTSNAFAVLTRQTLAVMGALAAFALAAATGTTSARTPALVAGATLVVLATLVAAVHGKKRRRALDLIIEGRERLPLAAVQRERRRLLNPTARARLAARLTDVLTDVLIPRGVPAASASLLGNARVLRANAAEICAVAALVRATAASAAGVALVERLLIDAGSALYGKEVRPLREELRRARYLLQDQATATWR